MARDSPFPYLPITELLLVFATLMFIVGSCGFLKGDNADIRLKWGDALFIAASFIFFGKSLHSIYSHHVMHGSVLPIEERHLCAEYAENAFYTLSCVIFIVACILFWPGLFPEYDAVRAEIVAVWLFVIGSMGFMMASYCNAILLAKGQLFKKIPRYGNLVYNISFVALLNSQIGGVFFVTGSFMFLPGFKTHCDRHIRDGWTNIATNINSNLTALVEKMSRDFQVSESEILKLMPAAEICQDIIENGAILYIIGSTFYFLQSALYLACSIIKRHADTLNEHDGCRTVSAEGDECETELSGNLL